MALRRRCAARSCEGGANAACYVKARESTKPNQGKFKHYGEGPLRRVFVRLAGRATACAMRPRRAVRLRNVDPCRLVLRLNQRASVLQVASSAEFFAFKTGLVAFAWGKRQRVSRPLMHRVKWSDVHIKAQRRFAGKMRVHERPLTQQQR